MKFNQTLKPKLCIKQWIESYRQLWAVRFSPRNGHRRSYKYRRFMTHDERQPICGRWRHLDSGWPNIPEVFYRRRFRAVATAVLILAEIGLATSVACAERPIPPYVKSAIAHGLRWLSKHEKHNGTFACNRNDRPAITSLAVMAFLARGYTPGNGPQHQVIDRGIHWILQHQLPDGYITVPGGTMYDQGISTVMLSEAYGLANPALRQRIGTVLSKAVALILAAQKNSRGIFAGGWRYQPTATDADISCTGWQLMALRGAADCGAAIPADAIKDGIAFVLRDANTNGGFAYQPGGPSGRARTGTGILALELMGRRNSPQAMAGGDFLLNHPLSPRENFYFYAVYYCSQAANQLGGKYYQQIYGTIRHELIQLQNTDGSWTPTDGIEQQGGKPYATAMAILALCVPYHYLPLYQR